jgi:hypothetical protein
MAYGGQKNTGPFYYTLNNDSTILNALTVAPEQNLGPYIYIKKNLLTGNRLGF